MMRPGAATIEIEPVHLFNLKDYRLLFTERQQAFFGDSAPGGGHLLFGARCCGEPAGVVWGGPDRNPGGLFLFHLYVPERFRRRGVGRQLLETVCAAASEAGFREVYVRFRRRNRAENALWNFLERVPGPCVRLETAFRLELPAGAERGLRVRSRSGRWRLLPLEAALDALGETERAAMAERERRFREGLERLPLTDPAAWRRFLRDGVFLAPFGEHSELPQFGRACVERDSGRLAGWLSGEVADGGLHVRRAFVEPEFRGGEVMALLAEEVYQWMRQTGGPVRWEVKYWNRVFQRGCLRYAGRLKISESVEDCVKIIPVTDGGGENEQNRRESGEVEGDRGEGDCTGADR